MKMRNHQFIFFLAIIIASSQTKCKASEDGKLKFTYHQGSKGGPHRWAHIHTNYSICNVGKLQSPIDLNDNYVNVTSHLGQLLRFYKSAPAVLVNKGHALQIMWTGDAGKIVINGTDYKLEQSHWHIPSENTINGKRFDTEMHLVHKNSKGEMAAVGIFFRIGAPDPFLSQLLDHIRAADRKGKDIGIIDPNEIRYGIKKYYRFIGSLTTPPCSQGVLWTVIGKVKTVSKEQIAALKEAVDDGYERNARPVQPLHGRTVYLNQPSGMA